MLGDRSLDTTQRVPQFTGARNTPHQAVLFADVSGSTRLYDTLGDRKALAVIERCMKVFSHATHMHGGRVIKTIGDEVMVAFPDAGAGCRAAIDMQFGITSLPESMEHGTSIYCGLHWGEVTLADDGDVFGDTVNVAARMVQAAKKGQIVISGDAVRVLPPDLKSKTRFIAAETVKGKAAPLELHELLWESDAELTEMVSVRTVVREAPVGMSLEYQGRHYVVNNASQLVTLGRDLASSIVTTDKLASRNHARVAKEKDRFTFTDFSSNGTYIQLAGQDEVFVRRDSMILTGSGTISFGRPCREDKAAAISFEIGPAFG